ncbi:MAG: DNA-primase RepB domain-containing protein [Ignisphaera sp.]
MDGSSASSISNNGVYKLDADNAIRFLQAIWLYTSQDARCFSIVVIGGSVKYKHFCLDDLKDYDTLFQSVRKYVSKISNSKDVHIYFQVLPLSVKPAKGRGSEKEVKIGKWLWVDFDYKEVVDKMEFTGCRELEDHGLECYYQEGDKWIHVRRPPLSQVLEDVKNKLGLEPTLVVDSGAGYHLYFRLSREVDASTVKRLEEWLVDRLGGDPQSKDLARILRLPGSINPRTRRLVQVIYQKPEEIDPEKLLERAEVEKLEAHLEKTARTQALRELSDSEILRITDLLKDAYRPGYRQFLLLYLSGWLAKARVSPLSVVRIAKTLYESTGDSDPLKTRLSAIIYSYKKAGIDVDAYSSDIEALTGVKPYGLEREIQEEKVKGVSGLQEILESTLGEDRALSIIHELSEMLQTLSPYRDSIIELIDYEKQLYAVANLRKLVIARAKRVNNILVYKERVSVVAPTRVVVYSNPIGGVTKYEITFEGATLQRPLVVGPALIDEIADRLSIEGLVYHRKLIYDVLSAIVQAYVRKGKAEIKTEIESPGFYLVDNRLVSVKYSVESFNTEKLRQALMLLNELAETWFKHVQDKFSTVIKWGAIAPFSYAMKQKGKWIPWLYLYGDSAVGKTTLGRIVLKLWGLDSKHEKTGSNIDTIARLGYVLSMSTLPVLVNEPGNALMREDVVEAIKNAIDASIVRGKYIRGTYTEIPALSCLIFTSNKFLPRDDALLRRFKVITFSYGEKIPVEKQREFKEKVEPRLGVLSEIGKCIVLQVMENPDLLDKLDGGVLLEKCYETAGLEKPAWLNLEYTETQDPTETIFEEFVERFKKYINDLYARYVSRIIQTDTETLRTTVVTPDQVTIQEKLKTLLEKHMLAGAKLLNNNRVALTLTLMKELGLEGRVSLKSLAEMLGWDYKVVKINNKPMKAVITTLDKLAETMITSIELQ